MISPAFLDELDRFGGSIDRLANARQRGEQRSTVLGEGLTFSDYRNYVPGDDTRLVDWKLYGRTGELYVKQFESERNLTVHVLLDASESMAAGEDESNKFEYAAKLGLGFCSLAAGEHNDFRFSLLGETFERLDTGASNQGAVLGLIDRLNATEPAGETAFASALSEYAGTINSRSLVLVASDFLADVDAVAEGLDALADNYLVLAHVHSPEERDPPTSGETIFKGMERPQTIRTYFGARQRRSYQERLDSHIESISEAARHRRAKHVEVTTDEDFFDAFARTWVV
ncbi:DUF58 domain-containing protein [Haloarcula pelagica]|uniref:DUF58 domain-containing protein n=1 Tax=Haloarcula pelagica TaxID=3033389 RepID=UPI0024C43397|nr:DUF58 domain-containing protein [Halomicroarcula sp. YJ-61-S]